MLSFLLGVALGIIIGVIFTLFVIWLVADKGKKPPRVLRTDNVFDDGKRA